MRAASIARDEVVGRIQNVFRDYGFDGASLAEIAKATGLGKSSLYHYFPGGKEDMAVAVLERIDTWMNDYALAALKRDGTPQGRLRAMLRVLDEFYVGGRNACVLGNLVVGGSREKFQKFLVSAFGGWIKALRDLAAEAGVPRGEAQARAEDAVVRIEGALIVAGGLNDPAPFKRALRAIQRDLLA